MSGDGAGRGEWLRFQVDQGEYALPLEAVAEVTTARRPSLIPRVSMAVGGVLNVRGEPLPVVDGAVLMGQRPGSGSRHAVILESGRIRVGVLVDAVSRIDRDLDEAIPDEPDGNEGEESGPDFVRWVRVRGRRIGLADAGELLQRATDLLTTQGTQGGRERHVATRSDRGRRRIHAGDAPRHLDGGGVRDRG